VPIDTNCIQPLDILKIQVIGTILDLPIDGYYLVEPNGQVTLGLAYGRTNVKGLTVAQAEEKITRHLSKLLAKPDVQVTVAGKANHWKNGVPPTASYTIRPGDLLLVNVLGTILDQPIDGIYKVEPTGTVPMGPAYGRAKVEGMTLEEAEKAIQKKLSEVLKKPDVQVTFGGWEGVEDVLGRPVGPTSRKVQQPTKTPKPKKSASSDIRNTIAIGDQLAIEAVRGVSQDYLFQNVYEVENTGTVALGAAYGRVKVEGLTLEEAEKAVLKRMLELVPGSKVQITFLIRVNAAGSGQGPPPVETKTP
jgi:protein involved in polysaccharide export with SLBB domain